MAMTPAQKNAITRNRVALVENMIITDDLLARMADDYSLTESLVNQITAQQTRQRQVSKFIDLLMCRPQKAFQKFIQALVDTDQDHLAESVDKQLASKFITERQRKRGETSVTQPSPDDQSPSGATPGVLVVTTQHPQKLFHEAIAPPSSHQHYSSAEKDLKPAMNEQTNPIPAVKNDIQLPQQHPTTSSGGVSQFTYEQPTDMDVDDDERQIIERLESVRLAPDPNTMSLLNQMPNAVLSEEQSTKGLSVRQGFGVVIVVDHQQLCDISIAGVVAESLWESSKFTMKRIDDFTLKALFDTLKHYQNEIQACDAFVLYYLGYGKRDGRIFDTNGAAISINAELLPRFTTETFPALAGKLKSFIFNVAYPDDQNVLSPGVDFVDATPKDPRWNDMVIFYTISSVKSESIKADGVQAFDVPVQALLMVACKFVGKETIINILLKVKKILEAINPNSTCLYFTACSSERRPVFLRTMSKDAS